MIEDGVTHLFIRTAGGGEHLTPIAEARARADRSRAEMDRAVRSTPFALFHPTGWDGPMSIVGTGFTGPDFDTIAEVTSVVVRQQAATGPQRISVTSERPSRGWNGDGMRGAAERIWCEDDRPVADVLADEATDHDRPDAFPPPQTGEATLHVDGRPIRFRTIAWPEEWFARADIDGITVTVQGFDGAALKGLALETVANFEVYVVALP